MQAFNDMKVATKLMVSFFLVLGITIILGIFSIIQLAKVNQTSTEMEVNYMPSVRATLDMNTNTSDFRIAELQHILSTDEQDMTRYEKNMAEVLGNFEKNRAEYEKLISDPDERRMYNDFMNEWNAYLTGHEKLLRLSRENRNEEARDQAREMKTSFDKLSAELTKLAAWNFEEGKKASHLGDVLYANSRMWVIGLLICGVAAGVILAIFISNNIRRQLGGEPAEVVDIANKIASGDLTMEVRASAKDAGSILFAMKEMRDSLVRIVNEVRGGTDTIASASQQIASGTADLSSRTEEQASSLEETASSMEELTSTVKQNADNARQANQLAVTASDVAVKGGSVVSEVVRTMGSINESARKIVDIIGVIDGIAFQTNILALNAAVEAARAGEQGRGFAVVAAEVRNLAQRSAQAAKEIKVLIDDSVEKVDTGSKLVDQAGTTMQEVVESIRRVNDIMAEISAASAEQTSGIEQINQAVSQMDQATQQNAALVEQSAAAAESMQEQAHNLTQVVSVFKLAASHAFHAPSAAPVKKVKAAQKTNLRPVPSTAAMAVRPVSDPLQAKRLANAGQGNGGDWEEF